MTTFVYTALEPNGRKRTGRIEAADSKSAVATLAAEGRFVTEIVEEKAATTAAQKVGEGRKGGKPSKSDISLWMRRLSDLAGAGLPLDRVLQVLVEQTENGQLAQATQEILDEVRGGLPISESMAKHPKFFPPITSMTLAAGEASGQFPQSAARLADLMENEVLRRSQIISALVYPGVLTGVAVMVVIFMLTFVVPRMSSVFEGMGDALPTPTVILLAVTGFMTNNALLLIGGIAAVYVGSRAYLATDAGMLARDRFLLNAPLFGTVVGKAVISRYARILGTLVFGGVPILDAIKLAGLASGSKVFEEKNKDVEEEVREGVPIAQAMKNTGVFPPVLTHMVAVGEETGDLPLMLGRVADSLDFEVETGLRRLTSLLEPIIVVLMGVFVSFVVLSVMLPILQAQDLVK
jgi:type IV pilus assembly protein PilC